MAIEQETEMRTRITATLAAMLLAVGLLAAPAAANGHEVPPHGHVLLLHAVWTGSGPSTDLESYGKCIDLAAGQSIAAHHHTVHEGRAGAALRGAGHLVVPTFRFDGCKELAKFLPPTPRGGR